MNTLKQSNPDLRDEDIDYERLNRYSKRFLELHEEILYPLLEQRDVENPFQAAR